MNKRPDLSQALREQIDGLLKQAGEAARANQAEVSEPLRLKAWEMLPEPKLGWDYYSNIIPRNNMLFYRNTKQFDKALHWLDVTRESYGPGRNDSVEFYAATVWYEMGDHDKAFEEFDRQFKAFKKRPFEGHDKKYLDFYLSRQKKK